MADLFMYIPKIILSIDTISGWHVCTLNLKNQQIKIQFIVPKVIKTTNKKTLLYNFGGLV